MIGLLGDRLHLRTSAANNRLVTARDLRHYDQEILLLLKEIATPYLGKRLPEDWPDWLSHLATSIPTDFISTLTTRADAMSYGEPVYWTELWLRLHGYENSVILQGLEERESPKRDRLLAHLQAGLGVQPVAWQVESLMFCYAWFQKMILVPALKNEEWRQQAMREHSYDSLLARVNQLVEDPSSINDFDIEELQVLIGANALSERCVARLKQRDYKEDDELPVIKNPESLEHFGYLSLDKEWLSRWDNELYELEEIEEFIGLQHHIWLMSDNSSPPAEVLSFLIDDDMYDQQELWGDTMLPFERWLNTLKRRDGAYLLAGQNLLDPAHQDQIWLRGSQGHRFALSHCWHQQANRLKKEYLVNAFMGDDDA
ncbi:hypothetical protein ACKC9G_16750 [Pokkaliibacter sp. CJK22405]|uniref:hypothetical protein n=1 Tax=Pokkaliibacter sp. CJK22405 TaxID=3384615 RepID=UPI003984E124